MLDVTLVQTEISQQLEVKLSLDIHVPLRISHVNFNVEPSSGHNINVPNSC